jgi:hypothetical protein
MQLKPITVIAVLLLVVASLSVAGCTTNVTNTTSPSPTSTIAGMISEMNKTHIHNTIYALSSIPTRLYGTTGNAQAATYLYNKLSTIPGLTVEYEGGKYNNIIATLPGTDKSAGGIVMVGAHYDSRSVNITCSTARAPGASDNAVGVAIVAELARVMSQHQFNHTIAFALWNAEEEGMLGSSVYTGIAAANHAQISLYFNYDGAAYDPENHFILDLIYNNQSAWAAQMMVNDNTLFGINFTLTYNNCHNCNSDQSSFWEKGYNAMMTAAETRGPEHSSLDTIDHISMAYVLKNSQLGLALLSQTAEVQGTVKKPTILTPWLF